MAKGDKFYFENFAACTALTKIHHFAVAAATAAGKQRQNHQKSKNQG